MFLSLILRMNESDTNSGRNNSKMTIPIFLNSKITIAGTNKRLKEFEKVHN